MTTPSFRVAASRLFSSHLSSRNPWFALFAVMFLVSLHMLASEIHELVGRCFGDLGSYVNLGVFVVMFLALWLTARKAPKQRLDVKRLEDPKDCKCIALILFLSKPNRDLTWMSETPLTADIMQQRDRERFVDGWRMAIEAIREHLGDPLKVVYVIGSAGDEGTARHIPLFRTVVNAYCSGLTNAPDVQSAGGKFSSGFDLLDGKQIQIAINEAFEELQSSKEGDPSSGINAKDIILDITGGYGICSAIAGAASMDEPHRFQHVATTNNDPRNKYKVSCYQVRYLDDANAGH